MLLLSPFWAVAPEGLLVIQNRGDLSVRPYVHPYVHPSFSLAKPLGPQARPQGPKIRPLGPQVRPQGPKVKLQGT